MKFILYTIGIFSLISCKEGKEIIEIHPDFNPQRLAEFLVNPENLPKEKIADLVNVQTDQIKIFKDEFSSNVSDRSLIFSWPNGEFKSVKLSENESIEMEDYSSIGLGYLRKISKEEFQDRYESKEYIQNQIQKISVDSTMDADLAILEMKDLAEIHKSQKFEKLLNIGELAYWETPMNALHIFQNKTAFTITTNMKNEEKSKKLALKFVELLIQEIHEN